VLALKKAGDQEGDGGAGIRRSGHGRAKFEFEALAHVSAEARALRAKMKQLGGPGDWYRAKCRKATTSLPD